VVLKILAGALVATGLWAQLVTPPPYGTPSSGPGSGSGNSTICNASASATAPTCPGVPVPASLTGLTGTLVIQTQTNGAPTTLNIAGLGAKNIYINGAVSSASNVLAIGSYQFYYDGTQVQVQTGFSGKILLASFGIDGGGSVISTGGLGVFPIAGSACTITRVDSSGSPSGSATMDIWKAAGAIPTGSDKISGSSPATLSSSQLGLNSSLSGWTTSVSIGDVWGASVATATTVTSMNVFIWGTCP